MADVFKKQITRWYAPDGKRCSAEAPGATQKRERSRNWYGTVGGKAVPLCGDKVRSQQMLNKLLTDAALKGVGLHDPYAGHRTRLLADHLADFGNALAAKGNSASYVKLVGGRLTALADGCDWRTLDDLSASQAGEWLARLRASGSAVELLPGRDEYSPADVAHLLGTSLANVRSLVKRHGLAATGKGKRRRLPAETVRALLDRQAQGASVQTTNAYRTHLKTFGNWLVKDRRLGENPFRHLEAGNAQVDRRHDRRELSADELRRVLAAARSSTRTFRGLSGEDRYVLYATACGTGFRAGALSSLTPASFDLEDTPATVTLAARHNKRRRVKVQPLPKDLADLLRDSLAGKPTGRAVWGGTWASDHRGAEMLRIDLEAAGVPYAIDGPDGPLYADFHSLRHTYLTLGGQAGIDLRTLQELAGHSTPALTARYSHRRLYDLAGAVEKLPAFLPDDEPSDESHRLRATGTDGGSSTEADFGCSVVARTPDLSGRPLALVGTEVGRSDGPLETTQPLISQGFSHIEAPSGTSRHERGRRDSNPQPPDRQFIDR